MKIREAYQVLQIWVREYLIVSVCFRNSNFGYFRLTEVSTHFKGASYRLSSMSEDMSFMAFPQCCMCTAVVKTDQMGNAAILRFNKRFSNSGGGKVALQSYCISGPKHNCSKWLFIDFLDKNVIFYFTTVGNSVQIIKYLEISRLSPILKL